MTISTYLLLLLTFAAIVATLRLLIDGGHGSAPRSHRCDRRFQPPSTWVQ